MYSIYNTMGMLMLIWYADYRWTMFADKIKYSWAYAPINITTAFLSIPFLIISLFTIQRSFTLWMYWLAIFLLLRNIYYTIEDVRDYIQIKHNPTTPISSLQQQGFFVALDVLMAIYVGWWILKYKLVVL